MAGSARRLALGAVLYRLRRRAAEALLRLFPQGRTQRLGPAAAGAAPGAPSAREVRPARRGRMAARAHAVDALLSRPAGDAPHARGAAIAEGARLRSARAGAGQ